MLEDILPDLSPKLIDRYIKKCSRNLVGTCISNLEALNKKLPAFVSKNLGGKMFNKEKNMIIETIRSVVNYLSQKLNESLTYFENLSKTQKVILVALFAILALWAKRRINKGKETNKDLYEHENY